MSLAVSTLAARSLLARRLFLSNEWLMDEANEYFEEKIKRLAILYLSSFAWPCLGVNTCNGRWQCRRIVLGAGVTDDELMLNRLPFYGQ